MAVKHKCILHIRVGNPDWTPSKAELEEIKKQFEEAANGQYNVVVTSHHVLVDLIP